MICVGLSHMSSSNVPAYIPEISKINDLFPSHHHYQFHSRHEPSRSIFDAAMFPHLLAVGKVEAAGNLAP